MGKREKEKKRKREEREEREEKRERREREREENLSRIRVGGKCHLTNLSKRDSRTLESNCCDVSKLIEKRERRKRRRSPRREKNVHRKGKRKRVP